MTAEDRREGWRVLGEMIGSLKLGRIGDALGQCSTVARQVWAAIFHPRAA